MISLIFRNAANENSKDAGNMPRIGGLLKPVVMKSVKVVVDKTVGVPIVSELVATAASAMYDIAVPKVTEVLKDKIKSNKTSKGVMKGNAAFQSVCHNHLATEKSKIDVKQNGTCEKTEETPRATEKVEKQNVLTDDERTDTVEVIPGPLNPDMKLKFVKPTYPIL